MESITLPHTTLSLAKMFSAISALEHATPSRTCSKLHDP